MLTLRKVLATLNTLLLHTPQLPTLVPLPISSPSPDGAFATGGETAAFQHNVAKDSNWEDMDSQDVAVTAIIIVVIIIIINLRLYIKESLCFCVSLFDPEKKKIINKNKIQRALSFAHLYFIIAAHSRGISYRLDNLMLC